MFRKKIIPILTFFVGLAVGALLVWAILLQSIPSSWFEVNANHLTLLSDESFLSDLPLADIISLKGRTRFIDHELTATTGVGLGYIFNLELSKIDPAKIPKKYSVDKPVPGSKLSESAITAPSYTVKFIIQLHDKDGFQVAEITGPEHLVDPGKINKITGQTKQDLAREKAKLVRSISVSTYFVRIPGTRSD